MTLLLEALGAAIAGRLRATDLRADSGELIGLIGPNGSGKTSLLHAIAGIGDGKGEVRIEGEDPRLASPDRRKRMLAYLPASRDVPWPVAALDLIRLGLPSDAGHDEAQAAVRALALDSLAERRVDRLSTGERSRVLIARALAPQPRLLLLDEPTANLDPYWQLSLMGMLSETARSSGQAVIAALHDLDLAGRFAGRLVLMSGGKVAADGHPDEVLGGAEFRKAFGVGRAAGRWEPLRRPADRRSSP